MNGSIEATRNYYEVGSELLDYREEQRVASVLVLIIPKTTERIVVPILLIDHEARLPRHIHIEVLPLALSDTFRLHLLSVWVKGEVVTPVQRDVEHLVIFIESLLCAIAVVDVPVEDAHSFSEVSGVFCCDCHVVKDAKAG